MSGMLEGVRVLDLTDESGRLAGKLLAEAGADVLRLHRGAPGAPLANAAGQGGSLTWWFDGGTRYLPLDLERPADRDTLRALAATADVFLETEAPGRLETLGLDHAALIRANPRLVQVTLTPFGRSGPRAEWKASDLVASALGGALSISGTPERPLNGWGRQSFNVGGYYAAISALAALHRARETGAGAHVDLSLQQCVVSCTEHLLMCWFHPEHFPWAIAPRQAALHWSGFYDVLPCADGYAMMTPAPTPAGLIAWLLEVGILSEAPKGPPPKDVAEQRTQGPGAMALLGLLASTRLREEIFSGGQKRNLAIGPVYSIPEAAAGPQLEARGFFRDAPPSKVRIAGPLWRGSDSAPPAAAPPLERETADAARSRWTPRESAAASPAAAPRRPLQGIRVLDFTWVLAGPFATRVFGDLGADVIKLQTEERSQLTGHNDYPFFQMWNRNKRSVGLNMKHARAAEIFRRLVEQADIVIDNFTPGVLERWGIGYEQARQWNPGVVYLSLSGCGGDGPWRDYVTFAPTIHALCGLTYLTNPRERRDIGFGFSLSDHVSGLAGAIAALSALDARRRTGRGQRIEISQFEVGVHLLGPAFLQYLANGDAPEPDGNRDGFEDPIPNEVYRCADGELAITARDDEEWRHLCEAIGAPDLVADAGLQNVEGRRARVAEIDQRLAAWASPLAAADAMERLQRAGVPAGVVQNAQQLVESDPQLAARDWLAPVTHDACGAQRVDRFPATFDGDNLDPYRASPTLGQHTFEVYAELLGLSIEEIAEGIGEELFI